MKYLCFTMMIWVFLACGGGKEISKTSSDSKKLPQRISTDTISQNNEIVIIDSEEKTEELPKIEESKKLDKEPVEIFNHKPWTDLLQKNVSTDGRVNYKGFIADKAFLKAYLNALSDTIPLTHWSTSDKLAYWINAYNAFTIKLIIDHYPLQSIKEIKKVKKPWDFRFIKIGKKWYTLNDIEHRILRKMDDPRIHFGINCASFSCPPLLNKAFTAQNVDQQLEKLTIDFINDPKHNSITKNNLQLSKIFTWFASDFKKKGSLIDFLNRYSKIKIAPNAKKSFKKYDWNLNKK